MEPVRDPIAFELFRNTLLSIADEMALTILRTAYSGVLRDNMDYSTAFCDGGGREMFPQSAASRSCAGGQMVGAARHGKPRALPARH